MTRGDDNAGGADGAAVRFDNVTVRLGGLTILDRVSATVPRGSWSAVVGPNGAGKTTLLMALLGQAAYAGAIRVPRAPAGRRPRIGYVPQRLQFDRGMPMTVREFLVMGPQRAPLWLGARRRHRDRARELLASVDCAGLADRPLGGLSGGELQRVLLALALQQDPDLLILDEPAAGVDMQGEHLLCGLLERLRGERGFTQIMVSHDLATVTHHATHVLLLNRRLAAEGPPRDVLTAANLSAVFGLHMGLAAARAMPGDNALCTCARCTEERTHD
jgi:zinc transport system ATP-binding protein